MFKNAEKKLGILIKISFYLSASIAFIIPICIMINNPRATTLGVICFALAFIIPILLYLIHLAIYTFAELCENVHNMAVVTLCNERKKENEETESTDKAENNIDVKIDTE